MQAAVALRMLRQAFRDAELASADLDARLLVEHLGGVDALSLIREPDRPLSEAQVQALADAQRRRLRGEPVHRILGFRAFHGLHLTLSKETLEPRPDTEVLVDAILPFLGERAEKKGAARVLDLGTGTGAIALALLSEVPALSAVGVDISPDALETAKRNAHINGMGGRFEALLSDWFSRVSGSFDAIVSNPPYIPHAALPLLDREVADHDPLRALDGGDDGLQAYRIIARDAGAYLDEDGRIAVEIGWDQQEQVRALFEASGFWWINTVHDLSGHDRVMLFSQDDRQAG
ncbi:peptide chain release factor N(5)-glutamine methyltransferase [Tianweitania sediminis]|uniref:Release factor glutamine methyltransferase n=1 Tax=Tianweitania sediminis TaxID=1502156 RepID=A0A8J7RLJ1_9HYPH|nr:peptide chain release factor N(5)-glutamine methyltransferase [Tianweitania sediminis]MBP0437934.1 peptide chain release factor N(5)-glutamine methyltransferase [Tianweitania sediminis]